MRFTILKWWKIVCEIECTHPLPCTQPCWKWKERESEAQAQPVSKTGGAYWAVQWSWFAWVNALCNILCKKSRETAASLLGRFLSGCCFTLCITMEVEPRTAKQYKCHHCCNYWGKGMEGGKKKVSLHYFLADQNIMSSWKIILLGHPTARAISYCLLPDTFWLQPPKMSLKLAVKNSKIHRHHLPMWRKSALEVKAAKGLKWCQVKVKGANNPSWTTQ